MIVFDEADFLRAYRGSEKFLTEGKVYYDGFLELLKDEVLLDKIRFANDVHKIPPLKSYILYMRDFCGKDVFRTKMSPREKQGLGACFGYLYKFIYGGYDSVQGWFKDPDFTSITTASYFVKRKVQ